MEQVNSIKNSFVEIALKAAELRWCTEPYCTTCGNQEIRNELRKISKDGGFELAKQLSELSPSDIVNLPNWDNCIRLAFFEIVLLGPKEKVLEAWFSKLDKEIYFADVILFYIIRSLSFEMSVTKEWINKCISLAIDFKNESLIESLIWTLGVNINKYPNLFEIANKMTTSDKIKRALRKITL
ncbi:MAG: hypothetical protein STSR0008_20900 [Ignavibacterium sp.]